MTNSKCVLRLGCVALSVSLAACAGEDPSEPEFEIDNATLWVSAQPMGHTFEDRVTVRLLSDRPSRLFYTLDGTPPTGANALEYDEPLVFDSDAVLLMFVAQDANGVWSKPRSELYNRTIVVNPRPLDRALLYDESILFFAPTSDDDYMDKVLTFESTGTEAVRISRIGISFNEDAKSFYEPDAFVILNPPQQVIQLAPGQKRSVHVRYFSTETIRSAAIIVESNDERARDGRSAIALWGRIDS